MFFLPKNLDDYIVNHSEDEPQILKDLTRETHLKVLQPIMLSGAYQGRVLSMISHLRAPKRVLEIGTFTGYSAICLMEGMPQGSELVTIDINEELEDIAARYFKRFTSAPLSEQSHEEDRTGVTSTPLSDKGDRDIKDERSEQENPPVAERSRSHAPQTPFTSTPPSDQRDGDIKEERSEQENPPMAERSRSHDAKAFDRSRSHTPRNINIKQLIGDATEIIPQLEGTFDLIFIDADKPNYVTYFHQIMEKVSSGSLIISDNVLWHGKVVEQINSKDASTPVLLEYNRLLKEDQRLQTVLLSVRDGLTLSRVL